MIYTDQTEHLTKHCSRGKLSKSQRCSSYEEWIWLDHTLRRSDENIAKQALE